LVVHFGDIRYIVLKMLTTKKMPWTTSVPTFDVDSPIRFTVRVRTLRETDKHKVTDATEQCTRSPATPAWVTE